MTDLESTVATLEESLKMVNENYVGLRYTSASVSINKNNNIDIDIDTQNGSLIINDNNLYQY